MKKLALSLLLISATASCALADDAKPALQSGDYVGVIGDSITEQRIYSVDIEDYLLMCQPAPKLQASAFGWSGETSWGLVARMDNDLLPFKFTVATTCYGMNDGGYGPPRPQLMEMYTENQTKIVEALKKNGVHFIVLGSPGAVDTYYFQRPATNAPDVTPGAAVYNKTLEAESKIDQEIAQKEGVAYADLHGLMMQVMAAAKAKNGASYAVAGPDGVHPGPNGHLVMAYAYLKALGCDGNIGTITVDLGANKAQATDGHTILSCDNGVVQVESTRYPFCFYGNPKEPNATTGIIDFLPFNQDLNRFNLVVTGGKAEKYKVTWGADTKEFSGAQLAKGINLAAEFLNNPFSQPFARVEQTIRQQQQFETPLMKQLLHNLPDYAKADPDEKPALDRIETKLLDEDVKRRQESVDAVKPVKYTIKVEAE